MPTGWHASWRFISDLRWPGKHDLQADSNPPGGARTDSGAGAHLHRKRTSANDDFFTRAAMFLKTCSAMFLKTCSAMFSSTSAGDVLEDLLGDVQLNQRGRCS
ncbi:hypothetical protein [Sorangium sp. So ce388]|uniref:hypothetical protein n=1 Tax=Sorangium sp. So ce388 TaxID=3133309 RepID=UPI003F5C8A68